MRRNASISRRRSVERSRIAIRRARGAVTVVRHAEGVFSRLPGLGPAAGLVYFWLLHPRGGSCAELRRLKALAEAPQGPPERHVQEETARCASA